MSKNIKWAKNYKMSKNLQNEQIRRFSVFSFQFKVSFQWVLPLYRFKFIWEPPYVEKRENYSFFLILWRFWSFHNVFAHFIFFTYFYFCSFNIFIFISQRFFSFYILVILRFFFSFNFLSSFLRFSHLTFLCSFLFFLLLHFFLSFYVFDNLMFSTHFIYLLSCYFCFARFRKFCSF